MPSHEVVIVGGGIAGGALGLALARAGKSVLVLEFQDEYRDLVRGESLCPWGMAEAQRMGIDDAMRAARPAAIRRWIQWDEAYAADEAPTVNLSSLCRTYIPEVDSPFAIHHYRTCEALTTAAREHGATVMLGVRDVDVRAGDRPTVAFTTNGRRVSVQCRLIIGATGRNGLVRKQLGIGFGRSAHHWGGGLAIRGLDEWPAGVQAMGTEGHRMFFVFPQRDGRARLYLNFPTELRRRYSGPGGTEQFLADFRLKCLPLSEMVVNAEPTGPCMTAPSLTTWLEASPAVPGALLIGDEAGSNDPVLGTGLSNALRDARLVTEVLTDSNDWEPSAFEGYIEERTERMRRLNFAASIVTRLSAEFDHDALERRKRAWERMRANPLVGVTLLAALSGPDQLPEIAFKDIIGDKLFGDRRGIAIGKPRMRIASSAAAYVP